MLDPRPTLLLLCLLSSPLVAAPSDDEPRDEVPAASAASSDDPFRIAAQKWIDGFDESYGEGFFEYFYDDGVMPRPYLVAAEKKANKDRETVEKEYAELFGTLYRLFFEEYKGILGFDEITKPVPVLIFDSKESYEKIQESRPELNLYPAEFAAGYYQPWNGLMVQWRQGGLWRVMFHEGTHQLVDNATEKWNVPQMKNTPWLQEGIAEYLAGHKSQLVPPAEPGGEWSRDFEVGQFLPDRYSDLQRALSGTDGLTVKELCYLTNEEFKRRQNTQSGSSNNQLFTGYVYAQGWALVLFLNQYNDGTYKPLFDQYFFAETRGEAGGDVFSEIFLLETDEEWEDFDLEFREWVFGDLRRMKNESK